MIGLDHACLQHTPMHPCCWPLGPCFWPQPEPEQHKRMQPLQCSLLHCLQPQAVSPPFRFHNQCALMHTVGQGPAHLFSFCIFSRVLRHLQPEPSHCRQPEAVGPRLAALLLLLLLLGLGLGCCWMGRGLNLWHGSHLASVGPHTPAAHGMSCQRVCLVSPDTWRATSCNACSEHAVYTMDLTCSCSRPCLLGR